jgi:hypothetical protein
MQYGACIIRCTTITNKLKHRNAARTCMYVYTELCMYVYTYAQCTVYDCVLLMQMCICVRVCASICAYA